MRQNCSRAEVLTALLRIRSRANSLSSALLLESITSRPLTMAPTGLMRSWQTLEDSNAARSRASGAPEVPDMRISCCVLECDKDPPLHFRSRITPDRDLIHREACRGHTGHRGTTVGQERDCG